MDPAGWLLLFWETKCPSVCWKSALCACTRMMHAWMDACMHACIQGRLESSCLLSTFHKRIHDSRGLPLGPGSWVLNGLFVWVEDTRGKRRSIHAGLLLPSLRLSRKGTQQCLRLLWRLGVAGVQVYTKDALGR